MHMMPHFSFVCAVIRTGPSLLSRSRGLRDCLETYRVKSFTPGLADESIEVSTIVTDLLNATGQTVQQQSQRAIR